MKMYDLIVVGGGIAGMTAAITAGKCQPGLRILLLEGKEALGKKIALTGNGRCNFTNANMSPAYYNTDSAGVDRDWWLREFLNLPKEGSVTACPAEEEDYGVSAVLQFMKDELMVLCEEKQGYYYPSSGQAQTVQTAYRRLANRLAEVTYGKVKNIEKTTDGYRITAEHTDGAARGKKGSIGKEITYQGTNCILACGGTAYPKTGSDGSGYMLARRMGIRVNPWHPGLCPLIAAQPEGICKKWAGIRAHASVKAVNAGRILAAAEGEVQLTDYGLSGIPVFQISRFLSDSKKEGDDYRVYIDFVPRLSEAQLQYEIERRIAAFGDFRGIIHEKLYDAMEFEKSKTPWKAMKHVELAIAAAKGYDMAQVCAGGIDLTDINPKTMQHAGTGVYCVGEILDLDGLCGGYNIHAAVIGGIRAGRSIHDSYLTD